MSAVTALVSRIRSCGCHGDIPAALARAAQHPVPAQRRAVDHGRQRLALAQRGDAADDVARRPFALPPGRPWSPWHAQRRGGGLQRQLDGTGSTATASPLGSAMTRVLKTCCGVDTLDPRELVDGLVAERLVARVVVVLQHLVGDLRGQQGRDRRGCRTCHGLSQYVRRRGNNGHRVHRCC